MKRLGLTGNTSSLKWIGPEVQVACILLIYLISLEVGQYEEVFSQVVDYSQELGGKRELMERFPQSTSSVSDDVNASLLAQPEGDGEEAEEHIHMPNPSYWPLLLSIAVVIAIVALLLVFTAPWILLIVFPLVLIGILGWGLENPMAPVKEKFDLVYQAAKADHWKFKIGQNVVDKQGNWLGTVRGRFTRYILVERGSFLPKVYYVPQSVIRDQIKNNTIFLTLSEEELVSKGFTHVPEDLYEEAPEHAVPVVRGRPLFSNRPLSPAETGHYNYGRMWPGINTDASGSYHRGEVNPTPQSYVTDDIVSTDANIPVRTISPD